MMEILPGGSIPVSPVITTQSVNVIAATTGHQITAKEM
jgi:hypothetical protein